MTDAIGPPVTRVESAVPPAGADTVPALTGSFYERTDWRSCFITASLLLVIYLCTLAPDVTLENSGTLATGAAYAGVPDCPGYPAWTIYSWLFARLLPLSTIAWRIEVGSALAGAFACGLVALMVSRGGRLLFEPSPKFSHWNQHDWHKARIACGSVAGLGLGLSVPVWQRAVIVEIWTFGLLLFAALLCLLMRWLVGPNGGQYLYWAAFTYGVLLTNNWETALLLPSVLLVMFVGNRQLGRDVTIAVVGVILLVWLVFMPGLFGPFSETISTRDATILMALAFSPAVITMLVRIIVTKRAGTEWKTALRCLFFFFLGFALLFYSPIASMMNPPLNWAYPRTVEGFIHLITRGQYEDVYPATSAAEFVSQLWIVIKDASGGFGWYYLLPAVVPFFFVRGAKLAARTWLLSLAVLLVYVGPLMVCMLNPQADKSTMETIRPYWTAACAILAIWSGLGMMAGAGMLTRPAVTSACPARP